MGASAFGNRLTDRMTRAGIAISPAQLAQLETYFSLLSRWNKRINLTALPLDPPSDHAIDRLFVEAIAVSPFVPDAGLTWFDLGSGGGSPAIPLKIVRPRARLTMVESRGRKAAFLKAVIREVELTETTVAQERFEAIAGRADLLGSADMITLRGIRPDELVYGTAYALLRRAGRLLLFQSADTSILVPTEFAIGRTVELLPEVKAGSFLIELVRV